MHGSANSKLKAASQFPISPSLSKLWIIAWISSTNKAADCRITDWVNARPVSAVNKRCHPFLTVPAPDAVPARKHSNNSQLLFWVTLENDTPKKDGPCRCTSERCATTTAVCFRLLDRTPDSIRSAIFPKASPCPPSWIVSTPTTNCRKPFSTT